MLGLEELGLATEKQDAAVVKMKHSSMYDNDGSHLMMMKQK